MSKIIVLSSGVDRHLDLESRLAHRNWLKMSCLGDLNGLVNRRLDRLVNCLLRYCSHRNWLVLVVASRIVWLPGAVIDWKLDLLGEVHFINLEFAWT